MMNSIKSLNPNINFKAKFINTANVNKRIASDYKRIETSFVELDENNKADYDTLVHLTQDWEQEPPVYCTFMNSILNDIDYRKNIGLYTTKNHIYALTNQSHNFKNLDKDKILGVVEFSEGNITNSIDYLQVKPELVKHFDDKKEYKGIGSAILNSLKELSDKSIDVTSSKSARNFYKKNGFEEFFVEGNCYIWEKQL